jgi:hypothetical protein
MLIHAFLPVLRAASLWALALCATRKPGCASDSCTPSLAGRHAAQLADPEGLHSKRSPSTLAPPSAQGIITLLPLHYFMACARPELVCSSLRRVFITLSLSLLLALGLIASAHSCLRSPGVPAQGLLNLVAVPSSHSTRS